MNRYVPSIEEPRLSEFFLEELNQMQQELQFGFTTVRG
jgi:hypothetical protein